MTIAQRTPSAEVRRRLDHPVIDADGHQVEFLAPIEDYVKAIGGTKFAVRFPRVVQRIVPESNAERRKKGGVCPPWWNLPAKNTLDRATAALPKLLYKRLEDLGLDFVVLFPTTGLGLDVFRAGSTAIDARFDPEVQQVRERAINTYRADICREYADRMTPVAQIPMDTPKIAIEELEYAVKTLGSKAIAITAVHRPIPTLLQKHPELFAPRSQFVHLGCQLDTLGLDSDYDYDPFWAKCVELRVPVMDHGGAVGWTGRHSASNHMFNTIGSFADAGEAVCKSLFMAGVPRRHPTLKFAFLEGGVAWACRLYSDMVQRWKKRNLETVHNYNPAHLDREMFYKLHERYGHQVMRTKLQRLIETTPGHEPEEVPPEMLDEWYGCRIQRAEEIRDIFTRNFFFGCEGDDPPTPIAFKGELWPLGARLNALFSSDIGHWDVPDMNDVLREAHEPVDHGLMTDEDFRDFTFSNQVKLFAGSNPDFFKGTAVEQETAKELERLKKTGAV